MLLFWNVKGNLCGKLFHQIYSLEPGNLREKTSVFYENSLLFTKDWIITYPSLQSFSVIEMYFS